jgi:hypothetical protein
MKGRAPQEALHAIDRLNADGPIPEIGARILLELGK